MPELIEKLQQRGVLHSPSIIRALEDVDRADFLPDDLKEIAYEDTALPIGEAQTIYQPYTVVFMLEQLQVRPGDIILEVGYGSCWQTALLAHLVGPSGRVYALEVALNLCRQGEANLSKYTQLMKRTECVCMNAKDGYAKAAPFDRCIAAAEVEEVPEEWRGQLLPRGRMIYPRGSALILEVKHSDGTFTTQEFPGFVFVPFVKE